MGYSSSLPASFTANSYIAAGALGDLTGGAKSIPFKDLKFAANPPISFADAYSGNFNLSSSILDPGWSFITAPEIFSWDVANQAYRVDIFGTYNPPVVAGSRGMRDLSLGNSLVEGFVRGVTVEGKIAALENLMNYKLNQTDGFVSVPVYQVTANDKVYGNGFFIIKDIKINEKMRDTKGYTTRAYVDISLMEVPEYQVNSGRDQASQVAASVKSILPTKVTGANAGTLGDGQSGAPAGANSAKPKNPVPKAAAVTGSFGPKPIPSLGP